MDDKEKRYELIEVSELGVEVHNEENKYGIVRRSEEENVFVGEKIGDSNSDVAPPNEEYEVRISEDDVEGLYGSSLPENLIEEAVTDVEDSLAAVGEGEERDESIYYVNRENAGFHSVVAVGKVKKEEGSVPNGLAAAAALQSSTPVDVFFEEGRGNEEDRGVAACERYVSKHEGLKEIRLDSGGVSIIEMEETEKKNSCEYLEDNTKTFPRREEDEEKVLHDIQEENIPRVRQKPADGQEEKLDRPGYLSLGTFNRDKDDYAFLCKYKEDSPSFKNEKSRVDEMDIDDDDWGDFAAAEITEDVRTKGEEEFGLFEDVPPGTTSVPELRNEQPDGGWDARFHDVQGGIDSMTMQRQGGIIDSEAEAAFASRATEIFLAIPSVGSPQMLSDIVNKDELNPPPLPCALQEIPPWDPLQVLDKWIENVLLSRIPHVSDAVEVEEECTTADLYRASSTCMNTAPVNSSSGLLDLSTEDVLAQPCCNDGEEWY